MKEEGFLDGEPGNYTVTEKGEKYAEEQNHSRWHIVWSKMRMLKRPELLWHLRGLLPAIYKLGGQPTIDEIYNVVGSVCKSWT